MNFFLFFSFFWQTWVKFTDMSSRWHNLKEKDKVNQRLHSYTYESGLLPQAYNLHERVMMGEGGGGGLVVQKHLRVSFLNTCQHFMSYNLHCYSTLHYLAFSVNPKSGGMIVWIIPPLVKSGGDISPHPPWIYARGLEMVKCRTADQIGRKAVP